MTKLLQKAFDEASKLPEGEQEALGRILLEELASEGRWEELICRITRSTRRPCRPGIGGAPCGAD